MENGSSLVTMKTIFIVTFFVFKSILFIMAYSSKKYEVVQLWSKKEGKINGQLQTMKS